MITISLSLILSLLFITKIFKLNKFDPKLRNTFVHNIIQNIGYIAFDILIKMANRTNEWIVIAAFCTNFAIHVIAQYSLINNWYGEKKKD